VIFTYHFSVAGVGDDACPHDVRSSVLAHEDVVADGRGLHQNACPAELPFKVQCVR
jgi:hypothetical protein